MGLWLVGNWIWLAWDAYQDPDNVSGYWYAVLPFDMWTEFQDHLRFRHYRKDIDDHMTILAMKRGEFFFPATTTKRPNFGDAWCPGFHYGDPNYQSKCLIGIGRNFDPHIFLCGTQVWDAYPPPDGDEAQLWDPDCAPGWDGGLMITAETFQNSSQHRVVDKNAMLYDEFLSGGGGGAAAAGANLGTGGASAAEAQEEYEKLKAEGVVDGYGAKELQRSATTGLIGIGEYHAPQEGDAPQEGEATVSGADEKVEGNAPQEGEATVSGADEKVVEGENEVIANKDAQPAPPFEGRHEADAPPQQETMSNGAGAPAGVPAEPRRPKAAKVVGDLLGRKWPIQKRPSETESAQNFHRLSFSCCPIRSCLLVCE